MHSIDTPSFPSIITVGCVNFESVARGICRGVGVDGHDAPEVATIQWKRLDRGVRKVLKEDSRIAYRDEQRKEHCQGVTGGNRCEAARARLSQMVATYIRAGGSVPSATTLE